MTIRVIFRCSRCGSKSFRPSLKWTVKDAVLRKMGVTPKRCFLCRRRFYLFRPAFLASLLKALDAPSVQMNESEATVFSHPKTRKAGYG